MKRMNRWRSHVDLALRLLFPMVSFKDAFWVPMMAAAVPAAPFVVAWCLAATALEPDLGSTSTGLLILFFAALPFAIISAWYASFIALYCLGFAVLVVLASALSGCFWICEKRCPAEGRGDP